MAAVPVRRDYYCTPKQTPDASRRTTEHLVPDHPPRPPERPVTHASTRRATTRTPRTLRARWATNARGSRCWLASAWQAAVAFAKAPRWRRARGHAAGLQLLDSLSCCGGEFVVTSRRCGLRRDRRGHVCFCLCLRVALLLPRRRQVCGAVRVRWCLPACRGEMR